jgi:hypothetical protein
MQIHDFFLNLLKRVSIVQFVVSTKKFETSHIMHVEIFIFCCNKNRDALSFSLGPALLSVDTGGDSLSLTLPLPSPLLVAPLSELAPSATRGG